MLRTGAPPALAPAAARLLACALWTAVVLSAPPAWAQGKPGGPASPTAPKAEEPRSADAEEAARRAAFLARQAADKAAAERAAAERAEADRLAAERAEADRQAQRIAAEKAEAAKRQADIDRKRRDEAAVASDVDRVLARAKDDHPVLRTPEGAPLLQRILDRQKALVARGMYPSIAMVEAVADHRDFLAPNRTVAATPAAAAVPTSTSTSNAPHAAMGSCRWVTPTQWSCK